MYQFLVSTQGFNNNVLTELTDKEGNKTGYFFYKTKEFIRIY